MKSFTRVSGSTCSLSVLNTTCLIFQSLERLQFSALEIYISRSSLVRSSTPAIYPTVFRDKIAKQYYNLSENDIISQTCPRWRVPIREIIRDLYKERLTRGPQCGKLQGMVIAYRGVYPIQWLQLVGECDNEHWHNVSSIRH